jgi:Trypsin-like peptidase domain
MALGLVGRLALGVHERSDSLQVEIGNGPWRLPHVDACDLSVSRVPGDRGDQCLGWIGREAQAFVPVFPLPARQNDRFDEHHGDTTIARAKQVWLRRSARRRGRTLAGRTSASPAMPGRSRSYPASRTCWLFAFSAMASPLTGKDGGARLLRRQMIRGFTALIGALVAGASLSVSSASALDPQSFEEISSGVVKIRATNCRGGGTGFGSGFLIGTSVVVTAHHVVKDCRQAQVLVNNRQWIPVAATTHWFDAKDYLDVSTLKLSRPVRGTWLFAFRPGQAPIGTFIAVLGYPLAQGESYTNGRLIARRSHRILLKVLAAQGYSGGPIVDTYGRVVGLVNIGLGSAGLITGAQTGDNVIGYDFSSRWGGWKVTLCRAYPYGGIDDCP